MRFEWRNLEQMQSRIRSQEASLAGNRAIKGLEKQCGTLGGRLREDWGLIEGEGKTLRNEMS